MRKPRPRSSSPRLKKVPTGISGFDTITGSSSRSIEAVNSFHDLCEAHLAGRYDLEVIDLYQEPARAALGQVIASPTLVISLPKPLVRMVAIWPIASNP
jgi:hypothetical protein